MNEKEQKFMTFVGSRGGEFLASEVSDAIEVPFTEVMSIAKQLKHLNVIALKIETGDYRLYIQK